MDYGAVFSVLLGGIVTIFTSIFVLYFSYFRSRRLQEVKSALLVKFYVKKLKMSLHKKPKGFLIESLEPNLNDLVVSFSTVNDLQDFYLKYKDLLSGWEASDGGDYKEIRKDVDELLQELDVFLSQRKFLYGVPLFK